MSGLMSGLLIALFSVLLIFNFYFKSKILKRYRKLAKENVEMNLSHFLNRNAFEQEVLRRFPDKKNEIEDFRNATISGVRILFLVFSLILILALFVTSIR